MLNYLALMGWAMPDEREEFTLEEFVEAFTLERISLGRPGLRRREAQVAERQVPAAPLAEGAPRAAAGAAALRRPPPRGAAPRAGADRHARGLLRVRVLLLRGRGRLRRGRARKAMVPKGRTPADTAKALRALLEEEVDPILDWRHGDRRGGAPPLRGEGGLGRRTSSSWPCAWPRPGGPPRRPSSRPSPCSARRPAGAACAAPPTC